MDPSVNFTRIRIQLNGLERMIRIVKAELENQISVLSPIDISRNFEVNTSLSSIFTNNQSLSLTNVTNYQEFVPGVWISHDVDKGPFSAIIALKKIQCKNTNSHGSPVTRLSINPVYSPAEQPEWVLLESKTNLEEMRKAKSLRINFISFIELSTLYDADMPRHLSLAFYVVESNGKAKRHLDYKIPLSTMPFEHCIEVNEQMIQSFDLEKAEEMKIIIHLPNSGVYTLHVDHFSILAEEK